VEVAGVATAARWVEFVSEGLTPAAPLGSCYRELRFIWGMSSDIWSLLLGLGAELACGFLNTAAASGSAVSLPILLMIGLDPVSANATNRIPVLIAG
jgi:hypothetical protein